MSATAGHDAAIGAHSWSPHRLSDFPELLAHLFLVKAAAARANCFAVGADTEALRAVAAAAKQLAENPDRARAVDAEALAGGGAILVHHCVNKAILGGVAENVQERAAQAINLSQSTADVCATAMRLALADSCGNLGHAVAHLHETVQRKADDFQDVPSLSRTCLRDAVPVSLGHKLQPFAAIFHEIADEAAKLRETLLCSIPLGGTVVGTGAGASAEYRAHIEASLNELLPTPITLNHNPSRILSQGDDIASVHAVSEKMATHLLRFSKILRMLHSGPSGGWNEIELPLVIEGSMFFRGKNNPTIPETVLQASAMVLGNSAAAARAYETADPDLNVFEWFSGVLALLSARYLCNAAAMLADHAVGATRATAFDNNKATPVGHPLKSQAAEEER